MINPKRPQAHHVIINSRRLMMHRGSRIHRLAIKRPWYLRKLINLSSHNLIMVSWSTHRKTAAPRTQSPNVILVWLMIKNWNPVQYSQKSSRKASSYSRVREAKTTGLQHQPSLALCLLRMWRPLWRQRREIVSNLVLFHDFYHIFLIWNIDVKSKVFEEDNAIQ